MDTNAFMHLSTHMIVKLSSNISNLSSNIDNYKENIERDDLRIVDFKPYYKSALNVDFRPFKKIKEKVEEF